MTRVIANLEVDADRMAANLESTKGLVYSQAVLLALIEDQGLDRDKAYRIVQRNARAAWDGEGTLRANLEADSDVTLSAKRLDRAFDPGRHLTNSEVVFERLARLRPAEG